MGYLHLHAQKKEEPAVGEIWKWMFRVIERKPEIRMEGSFEKKAFDLTRTLRLYI